MSPDSLLHYVVESADATYHHTPDMESNEHRIGLPIVAGPFDTREAAVEASNPAPMGVSEGLMAVTLRAGDVPESWREGRQMGATRYDDRSTPYDTL
jgi:hypothetical protein